MTENKNTFSISGIFSESWKILTQNIGLLIIIYLISLALNIPQAINSTLESIAKSNDQIYTINPFLALLVLLCSILAFVANYGYIKILIKLAKSEKAKLNDLWYFKKNILSIILAGLLFIPFVLVICGVLFLIFNLIGYFGLTSFSGDTVSSMVFLSLLFIFAIIVSFISLFYFSARLGFVDYFIIDKDLGPINGITASWNSTKGKVGSIILFYVQVLAINLLGLLALGIGLLVTIPLTTIAAAVLYKRLQEDYLPEITEINSAEKTEVVSTVK